MSNIKTLFRKGDVQDVWNNRFVTYYESKYVLSKVKCMLISQYYVKMESRGAGDIKILNIYAHIKDSYSVDEYVKNNISGQSRSIIAKFRSGTYPLETELGRYRGIPREEGLCIVCPSGESWR